MLFIAANFGRWAGDSTFAFDGLIGEVRIYKRALPAEEIQSLYQAGLQGIDPSLSSPVHRLSLKPHLYFVQRKVVVELHLRSREPLPSEVSAELQLVRGGERQPQQMAPLLPKPLGKASIVRISEPPPPDGER